MYKKTERLAWLVMTLSFLACIVLALGVPLGIRRYVLTSTRPMIVILQRREGIVTQRAAGSNATVVVDTQVAVTPRSQIRGNGDADALLLFYHPDKPEAPIATIQLYGDTELAVEHARTPRFAVSKLPHRIEIQVTRAPGMGPSLFDNTRPVEALVETPQGAVQLGEGAFRLEVDPEQTTLIVNAGRASVSEPRTGQSLVLVPLQRTQITAAGLGAIYVGARDLLSGRNGDFESPLEDTWTVYRDWYNPQEDGGAIIQMQLGDDQRIVTFERAGESHAETGIRLAIDQDLRDVRSLRVRARVRISTQTLAVCGSVGTECPMMIRIYYLDQESGGVREWLQGFYTREGEDEPYCMVCRDWKPEHIRIPQDVWYDYESPDLLPLLTALGMKPGALQSIEIYASGWTYGSAIDDIAILVGD
ncbi:MAG: hypothetical protein MUF84_06220 [Anaerolineae bacterium]|nr:hypothetical protein [Anaerolineae bacterium]